MNVNPFSYLIEKLKGKVDKDLGWLNDTDTNTLKESGFYRLGYNNSNLPSIGSNAQWSTLYVNGNNSDSASQIFVSRNNRMFYRVLASGTWSSWEEVIKNLTSISEGSDISASLTYDEFVATADGYLRIVSTNPDTLVAVSLSNTDSGLIMTAKAYDSNTWDFKSIPVRKGQKVYIKGTNTHGSYRFYSYV